MADQLVFNDSLNLTGALGTGVTTLGGTADVTYGTTNSVTGSLTLSAAGALPAQTYTNLAVTQTGTAPDGITPIYTLTGSNTLTNLSITYTGQLPTTMNANLYLLSNPTVSVGSGGGNVSASVVCYASGTLIRTARGDVAVEHLAVGDLVVTASGERRPIRWLGHRDTDCARHPEPRRVWPYRVRAGALGGGLPYADLWLSPGHALCVDDVLIPVRCLTHGDVISQIQRDAVVYWHVELDNHDVLFANGVPAESYIDTGNRHAFDNAPGTVALHPDFEAGFTGDYCRPYVESGPLLLAARIRLFGGALSAPVSEPVHMIADGTVLCGVIADDYAMFVVPGGTRDLSLMTPSFKPVGPDIRNLGVVVRSLEITAAGRPSRTIALDDPGLFAGFHSIETCDAGHWRWTDGVAHFAPSLWADIEGAFILRIGGMFGAFRNAEPERRAA